MPTPDFVRTLRDKIGHDVLPLLGVNAVVLDAEGRVLLVRRADTDAWTPVGGIVEPGEQPAVAAVREVAEETGVHVRVDRLVDVLHESERAYPNGDRVVFCTLTFRCTAVSGDAHVADEESVEVRWCDPDDMPPMRAVFHERVALARTADGPTHFVRPEDLVQP